MQVADGKDRTGDAVTPPAGEREHVAFLRRFEIDHLVGDDAQAQRAVGAAKVVAQEAAEITPVEIARDESTRRAVPNVADDLGHRCLRDLGCEPAYEMIGLVGVGAHVRGAHVEKVDGVLGRVGGAARKPGRTLAQEHRDIRHGPQYLECGHGAAKIRRRRWQGGALVRHRSSARHSNP